MPEGTVYSEFQPTHNFGGISVKGDTIVHEGKPIDFFMCSLIGDFGGDSTTIEDECERLDRGEDIPQEFAQCYQRDATFDDARQYAVWSKADVEGLAKFLARSVGETWPDTVEGLCEEIVKLTESEANACAREFMREKEREAAVNGANLTLRTIVLALGGKPSEETNLVWILKRIEELRK